MAGINGAQSHHHLVCCQASLLAADIEHSKLKLTDGQVNIDIQPPKIKLGKGLKSSFGFNQTHSFDISILPSLTSCVGGWA